MRKDLRRCKEIGNGVVAVVRVSRCFVLNVCRDLRLRNYSPPFRPSRKHGAALGRRVRCTTFLVSYRY